MSEVYHNYDDQSYSEDLGGGISVTYNSPQKLHILTLLYGAFSFVPQIIVPALFVLMNDGRGDSFWIIVTVGLAVLALPSMYLSYQNFYYMFTDSDFVVYSGVFSKKQRSVPYRRIQNVSSKQNIVMKLFDLVAVSIETAGDAGKEAELRYVKSEEYERIKAIIGRKSVQGKTTIPDRAHTTSDNPSNESEIAANDEKLHFTNSPFSENDNKEVLYKITTSEMLKYGAMRLRPTVLVIFAWVYGFAQQFMSSDFIVEFFESLDVDSVGSTIETIDYLTLSLYIIASIIVVFVISWLIDILLGVNMLYGFTLTRENNKLYSERGLLNKVKRTIPLKKLQMGQYVTGPIKRFFGYYGLELHTAGSPQQGQTKVETKAIPLAKLDRLKGFMDTLIGEVDVSDLTPVSKLTIRRAAIRYLFFILAFCGLLFWIFEIWWPIVVLLPLSILLAYVRWKYRGYALRGDKIVVREGFFKETISIIPVKKIQNLHIYSTFFQRRLGLVSLYVDTAAFMNFSDAAIIDISEEEAVLLRDSINEKFTELSNKETTLDIPEYQNT